MGSKNFFFIELQIRYENFGISLILFGQLHLKANWKRLLLFYGAKDQGENSRVVCRGKKYFN